MKVVDLFGRMGREAAGDSQVHQFAGVLLRHGKSGVARANPVLVWIEAAIAVSEAANSYCMYAANLETTAQIQMVARQLESEIRDELRKRDLRMEEACRDAFLKRLRMEQEKESQERASLRRGRSFEMQLQALRGLQGILRTQRMGSGSFQAMISLQVAVDVCIDATLNMIMNSTGEQE